MSWFKHNQGLFYCLSERRNETPNVNHKIRLYQMEKWKTVFTRVSVSSRCHRVSAAYSCSPHSCWDGSHESRFQLTEHLELPRAPATADMLLSVSAHSCWWECMHAGTRLRFLPAAWWSRLMSRRQSCRFGERGTNGVPKGEPSHVMLTCCGGRTMASVPALVMNADNSHELCRCRPWKQRLSCWTRTPLDPWHQKSLVFIGDDVKLCLCVTHDSSAGWLVWNDPWFPSVRNIESNDPQCVCVWVSALNYPNRHLTSKFFFPGALIRLNVVIWGSQTCNYPWIPLMFETWGEDDVISGPFVKCVSAVWGNLCRGTRVVYGFSCETGSGQTACNRDQRGSMGL